MSNKNEANKTSPKTPRSRSGYYSKAKDFKGTLIKLNKYLKPYYINIFFAALLSIIAALMTVLGPYFIGKMITEIERAYSAKRAIGIIKIFGIDFKMHTLAITVLLVYLVSSSFNFLQNYLLIGMTQNLTYNLRKELTEKINKLPLSYFDKEPFGEVLSKVTNDVDVINQTLNQSLSEIFRGFTLIITMITLMFILSWPLALIVVTTTTISFFVARYFIKKSQRYFRSQAKYYGELTGHIEEVYSGQTVVRVFQHGKEAKRELKDINDNLFDTALKSQFISGIMMPIQFFLSNISYVLVTFVGAILYVTFGMEIGLIPTFLQYTRQINQPVQSVGNIANVLQQTAASAERVFSLLDEVEEENEGYKTLSIKKDKVVGNVEFKNVYFNYLPDVPVIKGFSANISAGQMVAIVGPTGAGKTTMVNLLMRFYEVDKGKITIDGNNIKDMKRDNVRNLFAMVLQDTWLFEGTILENLTYGNNVSFDKVKKAAQLSQVDHFINSLSGGYNFKLTENGANISQGQRQLLTICRAMLRESPMLILDEATSNVDTRTEYLIQEAMDNLMKNRTSFVIAHRLSTIKDANLILVVDKGNVIEQGTHEELISKRGFYSKLYNSQFEN